jgi:hypothetical protein
LASRDLFITEAQHYNDPYAKTSFMRTVFSGNGLDVPALQFAVRRSPFANSQQPTANSQQPFADSRATFKNIFRPHQMITPRVLP